MVLENQLFSVSLVEIQLHTVLPGIAAEIGSTVWAPFLDQPECTLQPGAAGSDVSVDDWDTETSESTSAAGLSGSGPTGLQTTVMVPTGCPDFCWAA